eukprot:15365052-Ditylum_brightwellii.AAC.2
MMLVTTNYGLGMVSGDIGKDFCIVPCAEKIWSVAGEQFGDKKGAMVVLKWVLYGLKTASASFHKLLGDFLWEIGFEPFRADQDLWINKSKHYEGYDYIATHVDDNIIVVKNPLKYMSHIEQHFQVRDVTGVPEYYLGNNIAKRYSKVVILAKKYLKEVLRKYQERHGALSKENLLLKPKEQPELDDSEFANEEEHKEYQHIIRVGQWLVVLGRLDITYVVSSLSRFSAMPRVGHLKLARNIFGYLKKHPKRGYVINPTLLQLDLDYQKADLTLDFGTHYSYFEEELDPRFPEPLLEELDLHVFCNADHVHDKVTGRSITKIMSVVGSSPVTWISKWQAAILTSTFRVEFTALKKVVEEVAIL